MKKGKAILYIHGMGGSAEEAKHYVSLFPEWDVIGFDYKAKYPWEGVEEFQKKVDELLLDYDSVALIANSIGAYFSLVSLGKKPIERAYFISPIASMERLILDMMSWAGVSEAQLEEQKIIPTDFGEPLSWEYLSWVRQHPVQWDIPTEILYGGHDNLQSIDTIKGFADGCGAGLTVMENGEHWFHTEEQMSFLDKWLKGFSQ